MAIWDNELPLKPKHQTQAGTVISCDWLVEQEERANKKNRTQGNHGNQSKTPRPLAPDPAVTKFYQKGQFEA